jgi:hypothetical protein
MTKVPRAAVNLAQRLYLHNDGEIYPITNWFYDGEECEPEDATNCVAGRDATWFAIDLRGFETVTTH